jgi:hypothetical protein
MIKSEDGIKCRGDLFWSVVDCSFEKIQSDTLSQDNIMAYKFTLKVKRLESEII